MKINLDINEENVICGWIESPIDEEKPIIEIADPYTIRVGFDKFVDGEIVKDDEGYQRFRKRQTNNARILELKARLKKADTKFFKFMDGELTEAEYAPIRAQRQRWRDEINELEKENAK